MSCNQPGAVVRMLLMYENLNLIVIDEENIAGCMVLSVIELCDERVRCMWPAA